MKRTFASIVLLVLVSMASLAQTGSATPSPAPTTPHSPLAATGVKVGVIDMQGAIAGSNEGQRDFEALAKKFEPRRLELQKLNTDIEELKKQLTNQGDKMSPEAHDALVKSIETKTKSLQRSAEDAQTEFQQQQNEVAQRILQKTGARDHKVCGGQRLRPAARRFFAVAPGSGGCCDAGSRHHQGSCGCV